MLGAANGMATLARATMVASSFGPRHYGSIIGAVALGGYERVFWLLTIALVVVGIGLLAGPARMRAQ